MFPFRIPHSRPDWDCQYGTLPATTGLQTPKAKFRATPGVWQVQGTRRHGQFY